ncbi:MAG: hypothetical protein Q9217_000817, partial [Psora testacea]
YGAQGERLVAGVVPLSVDKKKVLLIQSTRRNGWVIPKGGWETDEKTAEDAACREAWEEAGIVCKIQKDLGKIPDRRGPRELTTHAPRAMFQFFEATVQKEETKWPEMDKRTRKWMSYTEAKDALAPRPELLEALNRSSIRKSEGVKLGQVCAKDLTKRIPPASGSKAAQRDPVVELDVSSKSLTDEGFFELAKALIESILYNGEHGKIVRLEELCLRDNGLTPASLNNLSRVVHLACDDLRDLDLSNNNIRINTGEDVVGWERFLGSFSKCCALRRVDLSGNDLGQKGYEVLTKVYSEEQPIDIVLPDHLASSGHDEGSPSTAGPRDVDWFEHKASKSSIVSEPEDPASYDEDGAGATLGKHKASQHGEFESFCFARQVDHNQLPNRLKSLEHQQRNQTDILCMPQRRA